MVVETREFTAGPFNEGYEAWENGWLITRCPFNRNIDWPQWLEWMRGYKASMNDNPSLDGEIVEPWDR